MADSVLLHLRMCFRDLLLITIHAGCRGYAHELDMKVYSFFRTADFFPFTSTRPSNRIIQIRVGLYPIFQGDVLALKSVASVLLQRSVACCSRPVSPTCLAAGTCIKLLWHHSIAFYVNTCHLTPFKAEIYPHNI